ncbi:MULTISPECIES: flagellar hook-basal body complex protein FliE [Ahrensia]|uniref:flagellar hook-basal body complex protein FliE n=1 Tax=Ahrensia TaxID=152180 RepID=UPI0003782C2D|nr:MULTISPECIES: flagellar hook-basal body complex protein FliE [Ahrensia]
MIEAIGQIAGGVSSAAPSQANTISTGSEMSFSQVLSDMAADTVSSVRTADKTAVQGLMGNADTRQVVDAVMQAEQALQASIAVRDKIVTAYLEISRMSI